MALYHGCMIKMYGSRSPPSQVCLNKEDNVFGYMIGTEYLQEWANPKPNRFDVMHQGELLPPNMTIKEGITYRDTLKDS